MLYKVTHSFVKVFLLVLYLSELYVFLIETNSRRAIKLEDTEWGLTKLKPTKVLNFWLRKHFHVYILRVSMCGWKDSKDGARDSCPLVIRSRLI